MVYTNFSGAFFQKLCIITAAPAGKIVAGAVVALSLSLSRGNGKLLAARTGNALHELALEDQVQHHHGQHGQQ